MKSLSIGLDIPQIFGYECDLPQRIEHVQFYRKRWERNFMFVVVHGCTDVGGNREVVQDGVTGYLVPPKAPDALAKAMLR